MAIEVVFAALGGLLVGGLLGWVLRGPGHSQSAPPPRAPLDLSPFLGPLRRGELPGEAETTSVDPALGELREILASEWSPRGEEEPHAETEADDVVRRALGRLAIYLRNRVESPLLEGLEEGGEALEEGADVALGAVEDLEFFLEAPEAQPELTSRDLPQVVEEVLDEFRDQSEVSVDLSVESDQIPVRVNVERLKDAVFLILHNAAEFGDGRTVKVTLRREGNRAIIRVQDQGPGFTAEALMRALDPFYSTSPEGLGLGLPHALKAVRAQGGQILLRNPPGGGGEVEVVLPAMD